MTPEIVYESRPIESMLDYYQYGLEAAQWAIKACDESECLAIHATDRRFKVFKTGAYGFFLMGVDMHSDTKSILRDLELAYVGWLENFYYGRTG